MRALLKGPTGLGALITVFEGQIDDQDGLTDCLRATAAFLSLALANLRLRDTIANQEGLARELDLAAEIQRGLLPNTERENLPVHGLNRPIRQVSGDFFDFFQRRGEEGIAFALGDVSGKGFNAALLMAKTASLFRCLGKTSDDPAALLQRINQELCETASHGMFVTMVAGIYQQSSGRSGSPTPVTSRLCCARRTAATNPIRLRRRRSAFCGISIWRSKKRSWKGVSSTSSRTD